MILKDTDFKMLQFRPFTIDIKNHPEEGERTDISFPSVNIASTPQELIDIIKILKSNLFSTPDQYYMGITTD